MRLLIPIALATALSAGTSLAEPMTFDQALKRAQDTAPNLVARSSEVAAAQVAARAAGRLPDPKLRAGFENYPISGPMAGSLSTDSMTMQSLGIMQDVPNSAKRRASKQQAGAEILSAQARFSVDARDVQVNAALAWVDLYYARRKLQALDEIERAIELLKLTAASQVEGGKLRPAQSLEAAQMQADIADMRAELLAEVTKAQAQLVRWTGDPNADVSGDPPDYKIDPVALRAGLDTNPDLGAARAMSALSDAGLAAARAEKHSDWGWDITYQRRDPVWGDMISAGVTFSLPLFSSTRQNPAIEAKSKLALGARLNEDATRRKLEAQFQSDLADHAMHYDRFIRAKTVILPLAQQKAELELASYGAGTASLDDVLQSQIAWAEARVDAITREAELVRDGVRINLIYGSVPQ